MTVALIKASSREKERLHLPMVTSTLASFWKTVSTGRERLLGQMAANMRVGGRTV